MTQATPPPPADLHARWVALFPPPAHAPPTAAWSRWQAREQALTDLRALPGLTARIQATWGQFRHAQRLSDRAARSQRPLHLEQAREQYFQACVLAHPVLAPHFPGWPDLWDDVRSVITALCDTPPPTPPAPGLFD